MLRSLTIVGVLGFVLFGVTQLPAADVPGISAEKPNSGHYVPTSSGYMVPYTAIIPGTDISFEMIPVPGGKFKMGSPAGEAGRADDEGPQIEVEVAPFWIGKHEITWSEYQHYMSMHNLLKEMVTAKVRPAVTAANPDAITAPSNLYDPTFTYSKGSEPRQPAISMSQYAAKQYTKWLSGISQQFYRLPCEAEWEYACRAGTTTAYSFGDDPAQLDAHAWTFSNGEGVTHEVGTKKPNPWGLHDMHGNVAEWVLDTYAADHYAKFKDQPVAASKTVRWNSSNDKPLLFPRVIRGGSYDDKPAACRAAARAKSDDDAWRETDPNYPKSPWWFTDDYGLCVGFRLVRPLAAPTAEEKSLAWNADMELILDAARVRIDEEGRGARGVADPSLIKDIETFSKLKK